MSGQVGALKVFTVATMSTARVAPAGISPRLKVIDCPLTVATQGVAAGAQLVDALAELVAAKLGVSAAGIVSLNVAP